MTMPTSIPCYWIEPAGRVAPYLRRFTEAVFIDNVPTMRCAGDFSAHNARRFLTPDLPSSNRFDCPHRKPFPLSHDDARWPVECDHCGYVFQPTDIYQTGAEDIYRDPLTGEARRMNEWGAGAMFNADWMRDLERVTQQPDGICLMVKLPDSGGRTRNWCVDAPANFGSNDGTPWVRRGDPRVPGSVTATPSIVMTSSPRFHAWLAAGQLSVLGDSEPW
jgi:hypothetical protein